MSVARLARTFDLPVVLSTVNVANGQGHTLPELKAALPDAPEIDRTTMNAWEDVEFRRSRRGNGPAKSDHDRALDRDLLDVPDPRRVASGYEIYPVVDAVGGTSPEAHRAGLERIVNAGAQAISWVGLAGELQRDWARLPTPSPISSTSC